LLIGEEGYLTFAVEQTRYLDMAIILAMSIRIVDPSRPICLITDRDMPLPDNVNRYFDYIACLTPHPGYVGAANKLRLHSLTPFRRTMYLDADCVMVRDTVGAYWNAFRGHFFTLLGKKSHDGHFGPVDVAAVTRSFNAPYMVTMNSGAFYFESGPNLDTFFRLANELYTKHRASISYIHRANQYADEPILGLAMGIAGIEPQQILPDSGSLMVTTWRARNCYFNLKDRASRIDKPTGFHFDVPVPLLAKGWVVHHPIIPHFIALKPPKLYQDLVRQVRDAFEGVPPNSFQTI